MKKIMAIDLGATSVRAMIATIDENILNLKEVMRFSHSIVSEGGRKRWQWKKIIDNIRDVILENPDVDSIGVDTWGVDFGLLKGGELIFSPVSYRDPKNEEMFLSLKGSVNFYELFENTGNQLMPINSLFQLLALKDSKKDIYEKSDAFLMMPDLINYYLTGEFTLEETELSTSQLYDLKNEEISKYVLDKFDIKPELFKNITRAKTKIGSTKNSVIKELRDLDIDVVSVCGHDTASAVMATSSMSDPKTLFLSCGTWSLLGAVTERPIINEEVYMSDISNEKGYGGKNLLIKNLTGLYLVEKLRSELKEMGRDYDFSEIARGMENVRVDGFLNTEDSVLAREDVKIVPYLEENFGNLSDFSYFKLIYNGLVEVYKNTINHLEKITGIKYERLHMIGGGAKSEYLCRRIKEATGLSIIAGPFEATVIGNSIVQFMYHGEIKSLKEGSEIVKDSFEVKKY